MDSDYLGLLSFSTIGIIIVFCIIRYTNKKCRVITRPRHMEDFYASQYFANNQSVNHFLVNENGISSLVIARVNHPQHLMGYVLDAGLLSPAPQIPVLPSYEEAVKPSYAPPKYEESSSGSVQSIAPTLPDSTESTARVGSAATPTPSERQIANTTDRLSERRKSCTAEDETAASNNRERRSSLSW